MENYSSFNVTVVTLIGGSGINLERNHYPNEGQGDESPYTPCMAPKAFGKAFPETISEHLKSLLCDHHCCSLESNLTEFNDADMLLKCPLTADAAEL